MSFLVRSILLVCLAVGGLWVGCRMGAGPASETQGTLHEHAIAASVPVADRTVTVWLPPGYDSLRTDGYPVLYAQDGQTLFRTGGGSAAGGLDQVLGRRIEAGTLPPLIVVGVHSSDRRLREYLPTTPFYLQPDSVWRPFRRQRGRPLADEYLQHLYEDVIPFVHRRYHTTSDPSGMFIMGAGVGGLFALYAAAKLPFSFGGAAAFAPDWTPGRPGTDTAFVAAFRDYWAGQWDALRSARLYADYRADSGGRAFVRHWRMMDSFLLARGFPREQWRLQRVEEPPRAEAVHGDRVEPAVRFLLDAPTPRPDSFFVPPALSND